MGNIYTFSIFANYFVYLQAGKAFTTLPNLNFYLQSLGDLHSAKTAAKRP